MLRQHILLLLLALIQSLLVEGVVILGRTQDLKIEQLMVAHQNFILHLEEPVVEFMHLVVVLVKLENGLLQLMQ